MYRRTQLLLSAAAIVVGCIVTQPPSAGAQGEAEDVLRVQVQGVRSNDGQVLCSLFDRNAASDFPTVVRRAVERSIRGRGRGAQRVCTFTGVRPGSYAVSVLHDEDSSGEMNTNIFGAPQEGWGVSNNAEPGTFSPPSFSDARFEFASGRAIQIRVRY